MRLCCSIITSGSARALVIYLTHFLYSPAMTMMMTLIMVECTCVQCWPISFIQAMYRKKYSTSDFSHAFRLFVLSQIPFGIVKYFSICLIISTRRKKNYFFVNIFVITCFMPRGSISQVSRHMTQWQYEQSTHNTNEDEDEHRKRWTYVTAQCVLSSMVRHCACRRP